MVRVRFAPSPTGNLHLGTVRAALFNWLFARHHNGTLVLRIEDTDRQRSLPEYEKNILDGLAWLGLDYDEGPDQPGPYGPYRQSERQSIYEDYIQRLLTEKKAYRCFCSEADLDAERATAEQKNIAYVYSGRCKHLSEADSAPAGRPFTIRFSCPSEGTFVVRDLIRGDIPFEAHLLGDFIIVKSDGSPSYNFAVVIDDITMAITHVIRGEDHISNTPRQLMLFEAFSATPPQFGHLPMILGADRSKLSKRHGATAVTQYAEEGFLPQTMLNYLTLLGWSHPESVELFKPADIVPLFSLDRVSKSGAIFDLGKLKWMNGQYIRQLPIDVFHTQVLPFLTGDTQTLFLKLAHETQLNMLRIVQDSLEQLTDIHTVLAVFFQSSSDFEARVSHRVLSETDRVALTAFLKLSEEVPTPWTADGVQGILDAVKTSTGLATGKVFKPIRIAGTGFDSGPHITDVLALIGKDLVSERIRQVLQLPQTVDGHASH